jgi:predicted O-methyltransferase YrrM
MKIPTKRESPMLDAMEVACLEYPPTSYLEIGVQDGHSLSVVVSTAKTIQTITLIDTWGGEYGGTARGNHDHIAVMLYDLGYTGKVRYLDGSSHEVLPRLAGEVFDLILVDGDHSEQGAAQDLKESWGLLATRGILAFDDITCPPHPWLINVWNDFLAANQDAIELARVTDRPYGVAVAQKA